MIRGKFNAYTIIYHVFTLAFLIVSIYFLAHPQLTLKSKTGYTFPAPVAGSVFLLITVFMYYPLAKDIFLIAIDSNSIRLRGFFKRKEIERSAIKSINLFSVKDFSNSRGMATTAISIQLENAEEWVIGDPFYSNMHLIKQWLVANFENKILPYKKSHKASLDKKGFAEDFEKIAGNSYTSVNGVLFFSTSLMVIFIILSTPHSKTAVYFVFMFIPFFYFLFGSQLNYFLISDQHLVVKNHFFPWRNKTYAIDDIIIANVEHYPKRSDSLRITTADFRSKSYAAGSLRSEHWRRLRGNLESSDILIV
jgi:hypothetical protein